MGANTSKQTVDSAKALIQLFIAVNLILTDSSYSQHIKDSGLDRYEYFLSILISLEKSTVLFFSFFFFFKNTVNPCWRVTSGMYLSLNSLGSF